MSRGRLRSLLAVTTLFTYVLVLLGIYTAATGAGLACEARWPLCDGAVFGLFPAHWPSFIEWSHRLVAMVTGFLIVGSAYAAWRSNADRRIRIAVTVAVALLPVQVLLGAGTVLEYAPLYLTTHFATAIVIFGALVLATTWGFGAQAASLFRLRRVAAGSLASLPLLAALSPAVVTAHTAPYQVAYNAVGLATVSGFVVVTWWAHALRDPAHDRTLTGIAALALVAALAVGAQLVVGRLASVLGTPLYYDVIVVLAVPGSALAFLLGAAALRLAYRVESGGARLSGRPS